MSYILCNDVVAKEPYYLEDVGISIRTVEELCYYLSNYVWLLEQSFVSEDLILWISEQCQMPNLAKQLYGEFYRSHSLKNFLEIILTNTGYCTKAEIFNLAKFLDGMEHMTEMERLKKKGDYLLHEHKSRRALNMYNRILTMRRNLDLPRDFYSKIWNNMGCAYAYLFLFEDAARCMRMAYRENKTSETARRFVESLSFFCSEEQVRLIASEEHFKEEEIQRILDEAKATASFEASLHETEEEPLDVNNIAHQLKQKYVADNL